MIRLGLYQPPDLVQSARTVIVALVVATFSAVAPASAQTLTLDFFQRYLDSYREQYGIPALSGVVVQRGQVIWEAGLGRQDIEANVAARSDTPYYIGNLSQIFGATLLLEKCYDQNTLELRDEVTRWVPGYTDPVATVGQLLTHQTPSGAYAYDTTRFAGLTGVIEECADLPYRHVLAGDVFDRVPGMTRSVPGRALTGVAFPGAAEFSPAQLARYNDILGQMARHYRLDRGQSVRVAVPPLAADAATGVITTALDLMAFDNALRAPSALLSREALTAAWTQAGGPSPLPTGLGWFVQNYKNTEPLVWQFDLTRDVASSIIIKLPARDLTFILLANSDGLTRTSNLAAGDALQSPFVNLFLRFFAP
jgi:CubicO group peptidase (beta-lactamase class C family)